MSEFSFNLQRFADYTITAGESVTITGTETNGWPANKTFSVTTGSETANYKISVAGTVVVSTEADGTVKFTVNNGYFRDFRNADNDAKLTAILLKGTYRAYFGGMGVTLGENGPTISTWTGHSINYASITLTPGTEFDSVQISPETNALTVTSIVIGGFSYAPAAGASFSATINKESGRTYMDVSTSTPATYTYDDGKSAHIIPRPAPLTYTPVSGTVTFAINPDGSDFTIKGLEQGDSFSFGDATYTVGATRLTKSETVDEETVTKSWSKGGVESTDEVLVDDLINADNFSSGFLLSDGKVEITRDSELIAALGADNSIILWAKLNDEDDACSISYGSLHKGQEFGQYTLNGLNNRTIYANDGETIRYQNKKFTSVEIEAGFTVTFNDAIGGVPISVSGAPSISSNNMTAVVTATDNDGNVVRKTIEKISPFATDEQIASLGSALNAFTDNTYVKTEKVVRIVCDA